MRSENLSKAIAIFDWLGKRRTNFGASVYAQEFEIGLRTAHRDLVVLEGGGWVENTDPTPGSKNTWRSLLYVPEHAETTPRRFNDSIRYAGWSAEAEVTATVASRRLGS